MEYRILGPLEVVVDGRDVTPVRPKQRALLALLLLRANQVVSNDELLEALWGEAPPHTAHTALHGHVSSLRKLLGSEAIQTKPPGYVLRLRLDQLDMHRFESLAEAARRERSPARKSELLRSALSLFRGEPLSDFRFELFAREEAARIEEMRLGALEERIEAELELGWHLDLIPELERLVSANRLRERLRGQLMLALYRAGRQAEALHVYQEGRQELAEELGIDPGPALQELELRILIQDTSVAAPSPAPAGQPKARRERKPVSILFCDLVGFTARSEELDPEDVQALLEPYFAKVKAEIERFGGTVEKFVGDAVMAVFGAPRVHEDDPERAVRAALSIRNALSAELELRIAVHTGEALVTLDADPRAGEGIVAGDVVNTASRLQNAAPANGVIVGEQTHLATQHVVAYRQLAPVVARGKREPLLVWEALEVRTEAEPRRRLTELVGRRLELEQLVDTLARARAERTPQLVTIVGVPGIGKTRLVHELYTRVEAEPDDINWLQGRSLPYGDGVTFWALGEIVKGQAGVFEGDPPAAVEEKLRLAVEEALGESKEDEWVLGHLRPLVGLGSEGLMTGDRRGEAFAAWRIFFEALAEGAPLVLVVEDLHWAGDALLDFVNELVDRATDVPMLVVGTSRPELHERRPGWGGGKRNATTVSLAPLTDGETEQLLTNLLGTEVDPELLRRAQGIPLFAEEYARLLLERGRPEGTHIPESLHALITARLDALPLEEKAIVQDAAVVGEVSWAGAVAAVGDRERAAVEELARPLEYKEFLRRRRRSSVEGETEFAFHHVLVRDVAYGQIPRAERGLKHRRAAEWIESLGRREDHVELLAHHYVQALELARVTGEQTLTLEERARFALRDAGHRAIALGAYLAATRHYRGAMELWPQGDPGRPLLLLQLARSSSFSGEEDDTALLEQAREALLETGDAEGAAQAQGRLAEREWERGHRDRAFEAFRAAMDLVRDGDPSPANADTLSLIANYMAFGGEPWAVEVAERALAMAEQLGLDELRAHVLRRLGTAKHTAGDHRGACRLTEESLLLAESIGSPAAVRAYLNLASFVQDEGDLTRSRELYVRGQELSLKFGDATDVRWFQAELIYDAYLDGRWEEAESAANAFIAEAERSPIYVEALCRGTRSRIRLGRGESSAALADSERGLMLGREAKDPQAVVPALATQAMSFLSTGRSGEAADLLDEMIEISENLPYLPSGLLLVAPAAYAHGLGRGPRLASALARFADELKPARAGSLLAREEFLAGADLLAEIGSVPDEALARLRAGEALCREGRVSKAHEQLQRALAFFRSVGATAYIRDAEALLSVLP